MATMAKDVVRVTSKGQATIPIDLRRRFGIEAPGRVRFKEEDEKLVVEPVPSPADMRGILREEAEGDSLSEALLEERHRDLEDEEGGS